MASKYGVGMSWSGLPSEGTLLGSGDKALPKGCSEFSGHSLASSFEKSTGRFAYYGKDEEVQAHLKKLKDEVDRRQLDLKMKKKTMTMIKSARKNSGERDGMTLSERKNSEENLVAERKKRPN
mmetsp:Transcript_17586/g.36429  ORF Transcript_17586/g.36429 Transcript_17586/m.36429 type:complete len:123 (+) Transcript_17586:160-528(+)